MKLSSNRELETFRDTIRYGSCTCDPIVAGTRSSARRATRIRRRRWLATCTSVAAFFAGLMLAPSAIANHGDLNLDPPIAIPAGWSPISLGHGVWVYQHEYPIAGGGSGHDYAILARLPDASILNLSGNPDATGYFPCFLPATLWDGGLNHNTTTRRLKAVVNGTFFGVDSRYFLEGRSFGFAFGLKRSGVTLDAGFDVGRFAGAARLLVFNQNEAAIVPHHPSVLGHQTWTHAAGGLDWTFPVDAARSTGRTMVGVSDPDGDGHAELLIFFVTKLATQEQAVHQLSSFGPSQMMSLDGGGSSNLYLDGEARVHQLRALPHAFGIYGNLPVCGDGSVAMGEDCDDRNLVDGDGCDSNCHATGCGNGVMTAGEECDDGNLVDGDGCDSICRATECGNGVMTAGEECDDGDLVDGDGCDSNCRATGCGNGVVSAGEECDDGNLIAGDGCDSNCTVMACGNGIRTGSEKCDDGPANGSPLGSCSADCQVTEAAAKCLGERVTILGSDRDDVIRGTHGRDVIDGRNGNDTIYGLGGDDVICGGGGRDVLIGGDGDDRLSGQGGADDLRGGDGDDELIGGGGSDKLAGGGGNDRLEGGSGDDALAGSRGVDTCDGGSHVRGDSAIGCETTVRVP